MKIFISHSSKDKWAARRISDDLISLGHQTFLDEKDIETGQSIDVSVRKHLKESDDFLVLLSPASVKSEWVLVELGGALALDKKIIPILLYVGANEIPKVISLKLSRDINSVQLYYDELNPKRTTTPRKKALKAKKIKSSYSFVVGDIVEIVSTRPKDIMRNDALIDWEPEMDAFLGKKAKILLIKDSPSNSYILEGMRDKTSYYVFAEEWLTRTT